MEKKLGKMLSFYKEKKVAPVSQNISDIDKHFHRRSTLYKQMGINPIDLQSKKVIEIGPGTGQNSLHLASLKPELLTLIEPNPTGVEKINELFDKHTEEKKCVEVKHTTIEDYRGDRDYDYVICEGLIGASGHPDPKQLISSIAAFVKPGGKIILTSIDYPAYLAEMIRRLIGYELIKNIESFEEKVNLLCDIYEPHLAYLPGMTRNSRDWAIDNLINPASVYTLVTFPDLVDILSELGFSVSGTSPRFIADWAWYKDAALEPDFFNQSAIRSYWVNAHGFLDYKNIYSPRMAKENKELEDLCKKIHNAVNKYEETTDAIFKSQAIEGMHSLIKSINKDMPFVASAVQEALEWLKEEKIDSQKIIKSTTFGSWFGRSQTYVLFTLTK